MEFCTNCGTQIPDGAVACPKCGKPVAPQAAAPQGAPQPGPQGAPQPGPQGAPQPGPQGAPQGAPQPGPQQQQYNIPPAVPPVPPVYQAPPVSEFDHTAEMDPKDISDNKVVAMLPYLSGLLGIIVCALLCRDSKFASFHVRQSLKLTVCSLLLAMISGLLFFTIVIPIAAVVCEIILFVLGIIGFVRVCQGKAIELPIVRGLKFLK